SEARCVCVCVTWRVGAERDVATTSGVRVNSARSGKRSGECESATRLARHGELAYSTHATVSLPSPERSRTAWCRDRYIRSRRDVWVHGEHAAAARADRSAPLLAQL